MDPKEVRSDALAAARAAGVRIGSGVAIALDAALAEARGEAVGNAMDDQDYVYYVEINRMPLNMVD